VNITVARDLNSGKSRGRMFRDLNSGKSRGRMLKNHPEKKIFTVRAFCFFTWQKGSCTLHRQASVVDS
jgi:hypothetical protein